MTDPDERVLEFALRELHGGVPRGDLAPRVAEALRRERADEPAPSAARAGPDRRRAGWAAALAGAAALCALWALLAERDPEPAGPPAAVARAPRPVRLLGPGAARFAQELFPGAHAALETGEVLALAGGGRMEALGPVLVLLQGGRRLRVEHGALRVEAGGRPLALHSQAGSLRLSAGARATVWIDLDLTQARAARLGADTDALAAALEGDAQLARWATVELELGAAELERPARAASGLAAGERWIVSAGGALAGPLSDAERERGRGLLEKLLGTPKEMFFERPSFGRVAYADLALGAELSAFLARNPHWWPALRHRLREAFSSPALRRMGRERAVAFLAAHPSGEALDLARELWLVDPESFGADAIVALAERGAPEFEREARAIVALEPAEASGRIALPAAWLALHGDRSSRPVLRRLASSAAADEERLFDALLAAHCLARTGEPQAWLELSAGMTLEIDAALARGDAPRAALLAYLVESLDPAQAPLAPERLGLLGDDLARRARERIAELERPEELARLLAELRGR